MAFEFISPEIDPYIGAVIVVVIFGFIVYLVRNLSGKGEGVQRGPMGPRGLRGERGERGEQGTIPKEELEELEQIILDLKRLEEIEISNIDLIIKNFKKIEILIEKYKDKPNMISLIRYKLAQHKRNFEILQKKAGKRLNNRLTQLDNFEKNEFIKVNYELGNIKRILMMEEGILNKKDKKREKDAIRGYINRKCIDRVKEAKVEYKLTKKKLEKRLPKLAEFGKNVIIDIHNCIVALDINEIDNSKKHLHEAIRDLRHIRLVLLRMEKVEKSKEKILDHELKDFKRERDAQGILDEIFGR